MRPKPIWVLEQGLAEEKQNNSKNLRAMIVVTSSPNGTAIRNVSELASNGLLFLHTGPYFLVSFVWFLILDIEN